MTSRGLYFPYLWAKKQKTKTQPVPLVPESRVAVYDLIVCAMQINQLENQDLKCVYLQMKSTFMLH